MQGMLGARDLPAVSPSGLPAEAAALVAKLLQRLQDQEQQLAERDALLQRKDREIALREAKIDHLRAGQAQALEVWRQVRSHERRAAPPVRGDAG